MTLKTWKRIYRIIRGLRLPARDAWRLTVRTDHTVQIAATDLETTVTVELGRDNALSPGSWEVDPKHLNAAMERGGGTKQVENGIMIGDARVPFLQPADDWPPVPEVPDTLLLDVGRDRWAAATKMCADVAKYSLQRHPHSYLWLDLAEGKMIATDSRRQIVVDLEPVYAGAVTVALTADYAGRSTLDPSDRIRLYGDRGVVRQSWAISDEGGEYKINLTGRTGDHKLWSWKRIMALKDGEPLNDCTLNRAEVIAAIDHVARAADPEIRLIRFDIRAMRGHLSAQTHEGGYSDAGFACLDCRGEMFGAVDHLYLRHAMGSAFDQDQPVTMIQSGRDYPMVFGSDGIQIAVMPMTS